MQFHIYAVWDFMSLLKELQRRFTDIKRIWHPKPNPKLSRVINELVLAEESDKLASGEITSHYDWYVRAMKQCGAWTEQFSDFYDFSEVSPKLEPADLALNPYVEKFLTLTFDVIDTGKDHEVAAYFFIGREALIPEMFLRVVKESDKDENKTSLFIAYLQRHIELDGEEHGPLGETMLTELCQSDTKRWQEAAESAKKALTARKLLWDGALEAKAS